MRAPRIIETWDVPKGLTARALSRNGAFVAECYRGGALFVRATETRALVGRLNNADDTLGLAVSDDAAMVALIRGRARVSVHELATGREIWRSIHVPCGSEFTLRERWFDERYVAFSPDNHALLVTADTRLHSRTRPGATAFLCDLSGAHKPRALPLQCVGRRRPVTRATFSPDGRWIPLNIDDRHLQLWDRERERLLPPMVRRQSRMVPITPERLWDTHGGRFNDKVQVPVSGPREIVFSARGSILAWNRDELLEFGPLGANDFAGVRRSWFWGTSALALLGNGEVLAFFTSRGLSYLELPTRVIKSVPVPTPPVITLAFGPRGLLYGHTSDHRIVVFSGP